MHLPRATYRVQLHQDFNFQKLKAIISYLSRLGISTIYAAPFFKATPGSVHGYDVLNPLQINPEIGTLDEFREISRELKARNMQWIQDIVPNHMAFSSHNPWIYDVLEKGPHSQFYRFFDIDWLYPEEGFLGKLMVPTLGSPLDKVLEAGEIKLTWGDKGFSFAYYDHHFPANISSYALLITLASESLSKQNPEEQLVKEYFLLAKRVEDFVNALPAGEQAVEGWDTLKEELLTLSQKYQPVKQALAEVAKEISEDADQLKDLLQSQYFRLTHWKITEQQINYRRFFTVNDLICLNMQDQKVFDAYHQFIKTLVDEDLVQGLRVDHIDGLFDPSIYLERLRKLAGKDTYIVVEKILEGQEEMPTQWPIEGSSGYEYLALSNQLFTNPQGGAALLKEYQQLGQSADYESLVYRNKHFILKNRMAGELDNLFHLMQTLDIIPYQDTMDDPAKLKEALGQFMIAFPIYRVYANKLPFSEQDMLFIKNTFQSAEERAPELAPYFRQLHEIFNGVDDKDEESNQNKLYFNIRTQQFTGPLAAKGVEDTTFYQYFPLISLNEVGDSPEHLGMSAAIFHQRMLSRDLTVMNTTATHDTKRGEDARMRINVLSELPEQWGETFEKWQGLNKSFLTEANGKTMPGVNDEYFLYQTMIGTFPFHISPEEDNYAQRLEDYLLKAIREAKVHTNWAAPNEAYEKAFAQFAKHILEDKNFMSEFEDFAEDIARSGAVYSLAQTLLRLCVPGVPDTYQGTEFWDLSMVDPDNRRPVDYQARQDALDRMETSWKQQPISLVESLRSDLLNPEIKLFTLYQALKARQQYRPIFEEGSYVPVEVSPSFENHLLAFRRLTESAEALVVIPLNIHSLKTDQHFPLGKACWQEAELLGIAGNWQNVFTQQTMNFHQNATVAEILADFPVALFIKV